MNSNVTLRQMRFSDIEFAAACTALEGWASETREVFEVFFAHDPGGCLIAEMGGERLGICVATLYGESGFVGELIVKQEMRGCGIGRQLLEHAIGYLHRQGARNVLLDGVRAAVPLYERVGFRKLCRSLRFTGKMPGRSHPQVQRMRLEHLQAVCEIDREAFGADRGFFLKRHLARYPELCQVLEQGGEVAGFIMGRRADDLVCAGPWVVRCGVQQPQQLLESLAVEADGRVLWVGVLEANAAAAALVRSYGMAERPEPPWRMLLGSSGHLGASHQCYAIGSAAMG